jgi:acyl-CoA dehydrogenase
MIDLELPSKLRSVQSLARQVAEGMFRPISRKYDTAEHEYPVELDALRAILDGMEDGGNAMGAGNIRRSDTRDKSVRNGQNMAAVLNVEALSWGDLGLLLTIPGQGLGNAAIAAVATAEQKERFGKKWAAMAITEPEAGSDSAAIRTTARLDEATDEWVLDGEKIFVTCGERADLVVVWASLDREQGRVAIKSFVVEQDNPGLELVRLEKKLGIRASDTATLRLSDCRIPRDNLLGSAEIKKRGGFAGVMQTFDNTRPIVAAMATGLARAALDRAHELLDVEPRWRRPRWELDATDAELQRLEAELESARLLMLKAAWMADNGQPNSMLASMAKAKAGRTATEITLRCVELCGVAGYEESELLEKWARDAKITDIFEGTQQIQKLIIARRLLGLSSRELR